MAVKDSSGAVRFGRGTWNCKMSMSREHFGWKDVNVEILKELSTVEARDTGVHCLEESAGGMGPGDGNKA